MLRGDYRNAMTQIEPSFIPSPQVVGIMWAGTRLILKPFWMDSPLLQTLYYINALNFVCNAFIYRALYLVIRELLGIPETHY